jgi:hypothetical protein
MDISLPDIRTNIISIKTQPFQVSHTLGQDSSLQPSVDAQRCNGNWSRSCSPKFGTGRQSRACSNCRQLSSFLSPYSPASLRKLPKALDRKSNSTFFIICYALQYLNIGTASLLS